MDKVKGTKKILKNIKKMSSNTSKLLLALLPFIIYGCSCDQCNDDLSVYNNILPIVFQNEPIIKLGTPPPPKLFSDHVEDTTYSEWLQKMDALTIYIIIKDYPYDITKLNAPAGYKYIDKLDSLSNNVISGYLTLSKVSFNDKCTNASFFMKFLSRSKLQGFETKVNVKKDNGKWILGNSKRYQVKPTILK